MKADLRNKKVFPSNVEGLVELGGHTSVMTLMCMVMQFSPTVLRSQGTGLEEAGSWVDTG